jgi:hypothetical protein
MGCAFLSNNVILKGQYVHTLYTDNVQNIVSVTCLMFLISHSYEDIFCIMLNTASRLKDIYIYKNTSKYVHVFIF